MAESPQSLPERLEQFFHPYVRDESAATMIGLHLFVPTLTAALAYRLTDSWRFSLLTGGVTLGSVVANQLRSLRAAHPEYPSPFEFSAQTWALLGRLRDLCLYTAIGGLGAFIITDSFEFSVFAAVATMTVTVMYWVTRQEREGMALPPHHGHFPGLEFHGVAVGDPPPGETPKTVPFYDLRRRLVNLHTWFLQVGEIDRTRHQESYKAQMQKLQEIGDEITAIRAGYDEYRELLAAADQDQAPEEAARAREELGKIFPSGADHHLIRKDIADAAQQIAGIQSQLEQARDERRTEMMTLLLTFGNKLILDPPGSGNCFYTSIIYHQNPLLRHLKTNVEAAAHDDKLTSPQFEGLQDQIAGQLEGWQGRIEQNVETIERLLKGGEGWEDEARALLEGTAERAIPLVPRSQVRAEDADFRALLENLKARLTSLYGENYRRTIPKKPLQLADLRAMLNRVTLMEVIMLRHRLQNHVAGILDDQATTATIEGTVRAQYATSAILQRVLASHDAEVRAFIEGDETPFPPAAYQTFLDAIMYWKPGEGAMWASEADLIATAQMLGVYIGVYEYPRDDGELAPSQYYGPQGRVNAAPEGARVYEVWLTQNGGAHYQAVFPRDDG